MKTSYQTMLHKFMLAKRWKVFRMCGGLILPTTYYKKKDSKFIFDLSNLNAKFIWEKLVSNIKKGYNSLGKAVCPFCINQNYIAFLSCMQCSYAKQHGICGNRFTYIKKKRKKGDYAKIMKELAYLDKESSNFLTSTFYKNLIKKLEKKYLKEEII